MLKMGKDQQIIGRSLEDHWKIIEFGSFMRYCGWKNLLVQDFFHPPCDGKNISGYTSKYHNIS